MWCQRCAVVIYSNKELGSVGLCAASVSFCALVVLGHGHPELGPGSFQTGRWVEEQTRSPVWGTGPAWVGPRRSWVGATGGKEGTESQPQMSPSDEPSWVSWPVRLVQSGTDGGRGLVMLVMLAGQRRSRGLVCSLRCRARGPGDPRRWPCCKPSLQKSRDDSGGSNFPLCGIESVPIQVSLIRRGLGAVKIRRVPNCCWKGPSFRGMPGPKLHRSRASTASSLSRTFHGGNFPRVPLTRSIIPCSLRICLPQRYHFLC